MGLSTSHIKTHKLFESLNYLTDPILNFLKNSCHNIILDISTFPKKFFFPITKLLLQNTNIENLIVTYSIPHKYATAEMSEDYEQWRTLPLFDEKFPAQENELFFVGAGHMAMGLPEQIEDAAGEVGVRVFIPFPGDPHSFNKNLNFVRNIEKNLNPGRITLKKVYARDLPEVFEYILSETENGQKASIFAPYGPKPISLAMCIYSFLTTSPVYYTQPRIYNPDYSEGVYKKNGDPQVYSYSLRINGKDLYSVV
jgi:hypothetical protein